MKTLLLSTALVFGVAVQAVAADVTPGHAQLAESVNVDPAEFSVTEIRRIQDAIDEDDTTRLNFLLSKGDVSATQSFGVTPGHAQLAESVNVDPNEFSVTEIRRIQDAIDAQDNTRLNFLLNKGDVAATQSFGVTPGHAQLAARVGVDPADFTVTELRRIQDAIDEDDDTRVKFLLNKG